MLAVRPKIEPQIRTDLLRESLTVKPAETAANELDLDAVMPIIRDARRFSPLERQDLYFETAMCNTLTGAAERELADHLLGTPPVAKTAIEPVPERTEISGVNPLYGLEQQTLPIVPVQKRSAATACSHIDRFAVDCDALSARLKSKSTPHSLLRELASPEVCERLTSQVPDRCILFANRKEAIAAEIITRHAEEFTHVRPYRADLNAFLREREASIVAEMQHRFIQSTLVNCFVKGPAGAATSVVLGPIIAFAKVLSPLLDGEHIREAFKPEIFPEERIDSAMPFTRLYVGYRMLDWFQQA